MDKRHGVPRTAPDANVSPWPNASSAYAVFGSFVIGCLVMRMKETSGMSICCTSTAMCAPRCPTPAAAREATARGVYSDAHTSATAEPSTWVLSGATLDMES